MGMVFERVKSIWGNLEESYEILKQPNESRKDFLMRIAGDKGEGPNITPILVSLEKEMSADDSLIEVGRKLTEIITSVYQNWDKVKDSPSINNLNVFVSEIVSYIKSKKEEGLDEDTLSYSQSDVFYLEPVEILARHNCVTSYVAMSNGSIVSTAPIPIENQVAICIPNITSLVKFRELIDKEGSTPYRVMAYNISHSLMDIIGNKRLLFLPKNIYRNTPSGCKVTYRNLSHSFYSSRKLDFQDSKSKVHSLTVCEIEDVMVICLPYEHSPFY